MIYIKLLGSAIAVLYGGATVFRKRMPLYYQIIFFAMASCFLGAGYEALCVRILPEAAYGFHVGYFGYIGMFFFLFSSYYGSIDSLADDREKKYRPYRLAAAILPLIFAFMAAVRIAGGAQGRWKLILLLIPVAGTMYYAGKHLIFPDVEMGIIAVMRPFNAMVLAFCVLQAAERLIDLPQAAQAVLGVCQSILLVLILPAAKKGVQKWFI